MIPYWNNLHQYAQSQNIGKPNNSKIYEKKKSSNMDGQKLYQNQQIEKQSGSCRGAQDTTLCDKVDQ